MNWLILQNELLKSILPSPNTEDKHTSSQKVLHGKIFPPKQHLLLSSADDWEEFLLEWGHFQKEKYHLVTDLGGANDFGIDVACFNTEKGFQGDWDNFQCKYYKDEPLTPGTAIPEVGKILWHIFNKRITAPKGYYFFAPKDCGASLKKLLLDSEKLKKKLFDEWDKWCSDTITSTMTIKLEGLFLDFVETFDFSIFQYKPVLEVIEEHRETPYYAIRFGGGLKDRPEPLDPPEIVDEIEVRYVERLYEAYADHRKVDVKNLDLDDHPELKKHFGRQRESFYFAESLRTFARDSVPPGTFEELKSDMFEGVIDTADNDYVDGLERLKAVMKESKLIPLDANGLFQVVRVKDRYGICHQLVNDDEFAWVMNDD